MEQFPIKAYKEEFIGLYGGDAEEVDLYFAPGRVNLLGEHTDYNGGYVLPFSLQYGTLLLARHSGDTLLKFKSKNFRMSAEVCLKKEIKRVGKTWINYPLGVIDEIMKKGHKLSGLEMMFAGNIPNGAGLSSSASIEMVTAFALNVLFSMKIALIDQVKLSQKAENDFVGMKCGIMDQFAVGMGKKDRAIFLNCDTLDYELVAVPMGDYRLMISNTNKRRELSDSKYNERRSQCEAVVGILNKEKTIRNLSELNITEWNSLKHLVADDILRKRAGHVITENQRVLEGIASLKKDDILTFGTLMNQSHESLHYDYEVSCFELDVMVEAARNVPGVIGSRMTGAGFGGCTINLVHRDQVQYFIENVGSAYKQKTGIEAEFYPAEISDGVRKL